MKVCDLYHNVVVVIIMGGMGEKEMWEEVYVETQADAFLVVPLAVSGFPKAVNVQPVDMI
jgi:imidazole glycerol phosphate synthase subunit HisF